MDNQKEPQSEQKFEKKDKYKDLEILILQKEIQFRQLARKEGEKGRNQALKILMFAVILSTIGIFSWISYSIKRATAGFATESLLEKANSALSNIDSAKTRSDILLRTMSNSYQQMFEEDWKDVRFQNNWTNYGESYNPAGYVKDEIGRVHLRGLVKGGAVNKAVFELPETYRPKFREIFIAKSGGAMTRVDIDTNGNVLILENYNVWVSLDGINFSSLATKRDSVIRIDSMQ